MTAHVWRVGVSPDNTEQDYVIDCHRGLRGPYTGLGSLLRLIVPAAYERWPGPVAKHSIELLSAAPELRSTIGAGPETLTSLAIPEERTRIYPANRTRRLAHGAVEFLRGYAAGMGKQRIAFHRVEDAEPTDHEFLAILLRRVPSDLIEVTVESRHDNVPDELRGALERYARRIDMPAPAASEPDTRTPEELVQAYIDSDGTSRDAAELAAYEQAEFDVRIALHDKRAELLRGLDEWSLHLGAIPYHVERGSDPQGAGVVAMFEAARHCGSFGFYHSVVNFGTRGRDLVDPATRMEEYWKLGTRASSALGAMGRSVEAEPTYVDLRARYSHPELHLSTGYALAMLYARVHPPELINFQTARAYINNSKAIATMLPDPEERAFHSVFQDNGLALIEMRLGRLDEAFRLVNDGISYLDSMLPEGKHKLHRSVLVHNRGKVYVGLGEPGKGLADFDYVIELDPNYPDYYFDRADAKRRLGDLEGAIADCDAAISISPPFYELYYNRADIKAELGDVQGAIADFGYVVELEPDQIDARVNVISLLLETGRAGEAWPYVHEGLRLSPDNPRLLHLRSQLWLERHNEDEARRDLDLALTLDPGFVAALASRATLAHESGDFAAAIADLSAALEADKDNPSLLYNRGFVFEASGQWEEAVRDYTDALSAAGEDDREELLSRRTRCQAELR